jgi:hypothetical protein
MPTFRSILALLAVSAVAAVVAPALAGCGSDSDEATTGGTTGAPAESSAPPADTPAESSKPPAGKAPAEEKAPGAPVGVRAKVCKSGRAADGEVRVTGVPCEFGRLVVIGWHENDGCEPPSGASRTSCRLGGFTCLGAKTGRGLAITCAAAGRSVAFVAEPR